MLDTIEEVKPPTHEELLKEAQSYGFTTVEEWQQCIEEMNQEFMKEYEQIEQEWKEDSRKYYGN